MRRHLLHMALAAGLFLSIGITCPVASAQSAWPGKYLRFSVDVSDIRRPDGAVFLNLRDVPVQLAPAARAGAWERFVFLGNRYALSVRILDFNVLEGQNHVRLDYALLYEQWPGTFQPLCGGRPVYRKWEDMDVLLDRDVVLESDCTDWQGKTSVIRVRMSDLNHR